jgi:hypothetical protein
MPFIVILILSKTIAHFMPPYNLKVSTISTNACQRATVGSATVALDLLGDLPVFSLVFCGALFKHFLQVTPNHDSSTHSSKPIELHMGRASTTVFISPSVSITP